MSSYRGLLILCDYCIYLFTWYVPSCFVLEFNYVTTSHSVIVDGAHLNHQTWECFLFPAKGNQFYLDKINEMMANSYALRFHLSTERTNETSSFHRKLGQDILNISVQGIAVTAQMWPEKTTMSVMVRTLEAVDLCTPGTRFPRILAPWVLYFHLTGIFDCLVLEFINRSARSGCSLSWIKSVMSAVLSVSRMVLRILGLYTWSVGFSDSEVNSRRENLHLEHPNESLLDVAMLKLWLAVGWCVVLVTAVCPPYKEV